MIIVVDTNIVFSALISPHGTISNILLVHVRQMQFYAPKFIEVELDKYEEKLLLYSGLQRNELLELRRSLLRRVELINHELIRPEIWSKAIELTKEVDEKDAPFVALALELEGRLWTGDKKLIKGLQHKDYEKAIDTEGLKKLSAE